MASADNLADANSFYVLRQHRIDQPIAGNPVRILIRPELPGNRDIRAARRIIVRIGLIVPADKFQTLCTAGGRIRAIPSSGLSSSSSLDSLNRRTAGIEKRDGKQKKHAICMLFCFCCCPPQGRELLRILQIDDAHIIYWLLSPAGAQVVTIYCYYNTRFAPTQPILRILCRTAADT